MPVSSGGKNQCLKLFGPGHSKMCLMPYANNKGADQPAHPCRLICTFVVRCLDSMICGERGGSVVECRTLEREVGGSKPTAAVLCP